MKNSMPEPPSKEDRVTYTITKSYKRQDVVDLLNRCLTHKAEGYSYYLEEIKPGYTPRHQY